MKMKRIIGVSAIAVLASSCWGEHKIVEPKTIDNALLAVTISDVQGFLDEAGTVAAQVSPMMSGAMLKSMIGMQLNDPQLAGIPAGKGVAFVMPNATNMFCVLEVAEGQLPVYTNSLGSLGMRVKVADGLLIAAKNSVALEEGVAMAKAVSSLLAAERSAAIKLSMRPASAMENNKAQIDAGLQMMLPMMNMAMQQDPGMNPVSAGAIQKMLKAEIHFFVSLLEQIEAFEVKIVPSDGSILFNEIYKAKAGSELHKLLSAPIVNTPNPKLQAGLLGDGAVVIDAFIPNTKALNDFFAAEVKKLIPLLEIEEATIDNLITYQAPWVENMGGTLCESIMSGTNSAFGVEYLFEVKDETAPLALFKTMQKDLTQLKMFEFYKHIGMPMSFEFKEAVRTYKEIPIHRFNMNIKVEEIPDAQRQQYEKMMEGMSKIDLAFVDNVAVLATDKSRLEVLIDKMLAKEQAKVKPLLARVKLPAGGTAYVDIYMDRYLGAVAKMVGQQPGMNDIKQIVTMLQGVDPAVLAAYNNDSMLEVKYVVPGTFLGKVGQAAMAIQMQKMQQAQPAPMQ